MNMTIDFAGSTENKWKLLGGFQVKRSPRARFGHNIIVTTTNSVVSYSIGGTFALQMSLLHKIVGTMAFDVSLEKNSVAWKEFRNCDAKSSLDEFIQRFENTLWGVYDIKRPAPTQEARVTAMIRRVQSLVGRDWNVIDEGCDWSKEDGELVVVERGHWYAMTSALRSAAIKTRLSNGSLRSAKVVGLVQRALDYEGNVMAGTATDIFHFLAPDFEDNQGEVPREPGLSHARRQVIRVAHHIQAANNILQEEVSPTEDQTP